MGEQPPGTATPGMASWWHVCACAPPPDHASCLATRGCRRAARARCGGRRRHRPSRRAGAPRPLSPLASPPLHHASVGARLLHARRHASDRAAPPSTPRAPAAHEHRCKCRRFWWARLAPHGSCGSRWRPSVSSRAGLHQRCLAGLGSTTPAGGGFRQGRSRGMGGPVRGRCARRRQTRAPCDCTPRRASQQAASADSPPLKEPPSPCVVSLVGAPLHSSAHAPAGVQRSSHPPTPLLAAHSLACAGV